VSDHSPPAEYPDFEAAQIWQPRGYQPPREVRNCVTASDGEKLIHYRAGPEEATTTIGNFHSWIRAFDARLRPNQDAPLEPPKPT
jgi:hypothetical protein